MHPIPPGHPRHRFPGPDTEPQPQRWMCAVCLAAQKQWEAANRDALDEAELIAQQNPHLPLATFLPEGIRESWPRVYEAITIATAPGIGTSAVCSEHAPTMEG